MARNAAVLAMVSVMLVSACGRAGAPAPSASAEEAAKLSAPAAGSPALAAPDLGRLERKVIRTADLGLVCSEPTDAEKRATAIAEELGGYVVSSDLTRSNDADGDGELSVSMVLRVPADRFTVALGRLRSLSSRALQDRVSSDDVTEEFIDLKARIVSQKALEVQFLEILKQSRSVKDALEVHTQLAEVRTTIEKLEGRKQFLESQTSLSTIKISIVQSAPLVSAGRFGFGESFKRAGADVVNVSAAIVHGVIRVLGVVVPIFALILLPGALLGRALFRRLRRQPARA
jgi:Domain of unknown function (DUF4349)